MEYSEKLKNSSEKFKTKAKNLKDSANPLGLLAENASKKRLF